jgi:hypothetical protein
VTAVDRDAVPTTGRTSIAEGADDLYPAAVPGDAGVPTRRDGSFPDRDPAGTAPA